MKRQEIEYKIKKENEGLEKRISFIEK